MRNREASLPFDLHLKSSWRCVKSAAARNRGQTQPAISQIIADIGTRLGSTLFDRKVRLLTVTAAGELLQQHANSLLADARKKKFRQERYHRSIWPKSSNVRQL